MEILLISLGVVGAYVLSSLRVLNQYERGVIIRLGRLITLLSMVLLATACVIRLRRARRARERPVVLDRAVDEQLPVGR